ncbi:oligosaccharide flippase family protein [Novispirillum sp. DQ9]|uniref:oligosaccharide flippase family protein n=1 Tax=Novispirillum sp. DQ9 TaxID=3398612 RepID=UPI003C7DF5FB
MPRPDRLRVQVLVTSGGEVASRLAQIVAVAVVGWSLGAEGLAVVGIAWSLTLIVQAIAQGGPDLVGVRALALAAEDPRRIRQVVADTGRQKLALAMAAVPLLVVFQALTGRHDAGSLGQLAAQFGAMVVVSQTHVWVFRGLGRSRDQALLRAVQTIGSLGLLVAALAVWPSPLVVPMAEAVAGLLVLMVGRARLTRLVGDRTHDAAASDWRTLLQGGRAAVGLGIAGLLSHLCWQAPVMLAARWAPLEHVGYLTVVMRLFLGANGVLQIGFQALYPTLARVYATGVAQGSAVVWGMAAYAGLAAAAGAGMVALTADGLLRLIAGPEFAPAAPLLAALLPVLVPVALASPVSYGLMARGDTRAVLALQGGAAAATLAACALAFDAQPSAWAALVLHPLLWGQAVATAAVARGRGALIRPPGGWSQGLRPSVLGRFLAASPSPTPAGSGSGG